jgi:hypothetical protein
VLSQLLILHCASINKPRDAMHNETCYEDDEEIQKTSCDVVETHDGQSSKAQ